MARTSTLGGGGGINFKDPWEFSPYAVSVANLTVTDSGAVSRNSSTTNFFTELARRGLQDTTNWTGNTYKTLLTVSSGTGLVACAVGPTAGGTETTTFEITVDGVLKELPVVVAVGQRALIARNYGCATLFNDASGFSPVGQALIAAKNQFTEGTDSLGRLLPWFTMDNIGTPCLKFTTSLLIRAKHSVDITNSTATAYSGVQYRLGL